MRMGPDDPLTAADVLNTYTARELASILRRYGEERFADRIAASDRRRAGARAVHHVGPAGRAALRRHPGAGAQDRRPSGQAHLPGAADRGQRRAGRAGVGAAQRRRGAWRSAAGSRCWPTTRSRTGWSSSCSRWVPPTRAPRDLPVVPEEYAPELRLLTRGAERPGTDEVARNPRAASARLRAAERIADHPARSAASARAGAASRRRRARDEARPPHTSSRPAPWPRQGGRPVSALWTGLTGWQSPDPVGRSHASRSARCGRSRRHAAAAGPPAVRRSC